VPGAPDQLAENLVEQGFFSFDDLSVIEPDQLAELSGLSIEDCAPIVEYAEKEAERLEKETAAQKAEGRRLARLAAVEEAEAPPPAGDTGETPPEGAADGVAVETAVAGETPGAGVDAANAAVAEADGAADAGDKSEEGAEKSNGQKRHDGPAAGPVVVPGSTAASTSESTETPPAE